MPPKKGTAAPSAPMEWQSALAVDLSAGKCAADTNPDAWFPDIIGRGGPRISKSRAIALETKRAIDICNTCPVKKECLEVGMEDINLTYGIWGGTTPIERVKASGKTFHRWSIEGRQMYTMQALQPYFEELGIGSNDQTTDTANGSDIIVSIRRATGQPVT